MIDNFGEKIHFQIKSDAVNLDELVGRQVIR